MLQHQGTTNQYFGCRVFSTIFPVQDTEIIFETSSKKWGAYSRGGRPVWNSDQMIIGKTRSTLAYLGCSTKCVGWRIVIHVWFAQSKIGQANVAIRCEKNIFRLEISINQIPFVHEPNSTSNFCGIHPKSVLLDIAQIHWIVTYFGRFSETLRSLCRWKKSSPPVIKSRTK